MADDWSKVDEREGVLGIGSGRGGKGILAN